MPPFDDIHGLSKVVIPHRPHLDRHGAFQTAYHFLLRRLFGTHFLCLVAGVIEEAVYLRLQERGVVEHFCRLDRFRLLRTHEPRMLHLEPGNKIEGLFGLLGVDMLDDCLQRVGRTHGRGGLLLAGYEIAAGFTDIPAHLAQGVGHLRAGGQLLA